MANLRPAIQRALDLQGVQRAAARGAAGNSQRAAMKSVDDVFNTERRGLIDDTDPEQIQIKDDIRASEELHEEIARAQAFDPKNTSPTFERQARTPEEWKARLPQLQNAEYANHARIQSVMDTDLTAGGDTIAEGVPVIRERQQQWLDDSAAVTDEIFQGRYGEQLKKFGEGSYTRADFGDTGPNKHLPMVMYHGDTRTDPTGRELIQFSPDANQSGLHSGSLQATEDIIAPTRIAKKNLDSVVDAFEQFEADMANEAGQIVNIREPFIKAVKEVQARIFHRVGDAPIPGDSFKFVAEVVDEIFEEFSLFVEQVDLPQGTRTILNQLDRPRLNQRLSTLLRANFDNNRFPFIANTKQALYMPDIQDWSASNVATNLLDLDIIDDDILRTIENSGLAEGNELLQKSLAEKGFDHIAYHNAGEDAGTLSFIFFNDHNIQRLYAPTVPNNAGKGKQAALSVLLAPLLGALNAPVRNEK